MVVSGLAAWHVRGPNSSEAQPSSPTCCVYTMVIQTARRSVFHGLLDLVALLAQCREWPKSAAVAQQRLVQLSSVCSISGGP